MNPKRLELASRRGALGVRIAEQRRMLGLHAQPLEEALGRGDAVLRGVDWLKHHPGAVVAAVAAVVIARPRRAWRWARRGFSLWTGWQALRKSLSRPD